MSFLEAFKQRQPASQSAHIDHPVPAGNRLNLADQLHFRQVERVLQQTLQELEQAKARISQLEKELAERDEQDMASGGSFAQPLMPPFPIAEISQLAEMAKRLR